MAYKFRKHQRLKSPADFKRVYNNKQWGNTRLLTFNAMAHEQQSQLGVTISKRVSKLAVRRNQLKRLAREFYRHKQNELINTQLVITFKPAANKADNDEIRSELALLWKKVLKWQRWHKHQAQKSAES